MFDKYSGLDDDMNAFDKIRFFFSKPGLLFDQIKYDDSWGFAYLIYFVTTYIYFFAVTHFVGIDTAVNNALSMNPAIAAKGNYGALLRSAELLAKLAFYSAPIWIFIFNSAMAGIIYSICRFACKINCTFDQIMCVWTYSTLILAMKNIVISCGLALGIGVSGFNIDNPFGSNFGYYFHACDDGYIRHFIFRLDIFDIASWWMVGFGLSRVFDIKKSKAISSSILGYVIMSVVKSII